MSVALNLTPATIVPADYDIAQGPALGGEREVYLTAQPSFMLGIASLTANATITWEWINSAINDSSTPAVPTTPIIAFVMTELKSAAAAVLTFGELTGTFTPATYAANSNFDFSATRGVELVGTIVNALSKSTVPSITNAKRGAKIGIVQLPLLNSFVHVGVTTSKDITVPTKTSKNISSGLDSTRYNKPGRTAEGKIRITARDIGDDDGLNRFRGLKCVAMVETKKEETLITSRQFFTNCVIGQEVTNPDSDGEASLQSEGMFQYMVTLVAPGS